MSRMAFSVIGFSASMHLNFIYFIFEYSFGVDNWQEITHDVLILCACLIFYKGIGPTKKTNLRPGHTALYGLITAKTRNKMVSCEAGDLFALMSSLRRATVDLLKWQDTGKNRNGVGRGKKFWTAQNFSPRTTTGGTRSKDVQHTWSTRDKLCSGSEETRWGNLRRRGKTRKFRGLSQAERGHRTGVTRWYHGK